MKVFKTIIVVVLMFGLVMVSISLARPDVVSFVQSSDAQIKRVIKTAKRGETGIPAGAKWQKYLPLARQYWGKSPDCPGHPKMFESWSDPIMAGFALMPGCAMWINQAIPSGGEYNRCIVVLHEWGHMIGMDHTDPAELDDADYLTSKGLMDGTGTVYLAQVDICRDAVIDQPEDVSASEVWDNHVYHFPDPLLSKMPWVKTFITEISESQAKQVISEDTGGKVIDCKGTPKAWTCKAVVEKQLVEIEVQRISESFLKIKTINRWSFE